MTSSLLQASYPIHLLMNKRCRGWGREGGGEARTFLGSFPAGYKMQTLVAYIQMFFCFVLFFYLAFTVRCYVIMHYTGIQ